jgi:hypothetical protein
MIPGPIGMAASGLAAAGYAVQGDYKNAALYGAGIALAAVGAGAAIGIMKVASKASVGAKVVSKANALATRAASVAWARGSQPTKYANMMKHFNDHGTSMGYKNAATYTAGAVKNLLRASQVKRLTSGSLAFRSRSGKVTFTYKGLISSFFSPRPNQWAKW